MKQVLIRNIIRAEIDTIVKGLIEFHRLKKENNVNRKLGSSLDKIYQQIEKVNLLFSKNPLNYLEDILNDKGLSGVQIECSQWFAILNTNITFLEFNFKYSSLTPEVIGGKWNFVVEYFKIDSKIKNEVNPSNKISDILSADDLALFFDYRLRSYNLYVVKIEESIISIVNGTFNTEDPANVKKPKSKVHFTNLLEDFYKIKAYPFTNSNDRTELKISSTNKLEKNNTPNTFKDLFVNESNYFKCIKILEGLTIIDKKKNFIYSERMKCVFAHLLKSLEDKNIIIKINDTKVLAILFNNEFPGFNLGKDGKTLRNVSSYKHFSAKFNALFD